MIIKIVEVQDIASDFGCAPNGQVGSDAVNPFTTPTNQKEFFTSNGPQPSAMFGNGRRSADDQYFAHCSPSLTD
jgi:hypothetical protein